MFGKSTASKLFGGTNGGRLEQPIFRQILLPVPLVHVFLQKMMITNPSVSTTNSLLPTPIEVQFK